MSYSTVMYGVDLDRIHQIINTRDTSVLNAVRQAQEGELGAADPGEPSRDQALESIIQGTATNKAFAHVYGYAFELLCRTLGEWLPDEDLIGDLEPLELQSPLETPRMPIPIPASHDFPSISFLTAAQVKQEAERLSSMDLDFLDDIDIRDARTAYADCINTAASNNVAIVSFYR